MSNSIRDSIYEAIASIRLIDPHSHINPHAAASSTLADLLGYHYYTELAHSAGMAKVEIEEPGLRPRELVRRLVENLSPLENTAQYRWLIEICRMFFGFEDDRITSSNWESLYDSAEAKMSLAEWPQIVLDQSNVEAVFLTNDFDDDLAGFDTDTYVPCLRTDDLVFHLSKPEVRARLAACTGISLDGSLASLRNSLRQRFSHFVSRGARACAISLPPWFQPSPVSDGRASSALDQVLKRGVLADDSHKQALSRRVFWTLAELCDEFGLPFDLMIGVNRGVYPDGVYQGQDLYDSRVSLIQYRELFNAFPGVKFPVSVLASVTNQELVSYAWIFPNVITNGHWWYSNTPSFIARDAAARLEAVPQTKQIGYYSDAYKLEFVWPKFDMYRRILAGILADQFVVACGWDEERAIALGRRVLRDNVDDIFPRRKIDDARQQVDPMAETWADADDREPTADALNQSTWDNPAVAASSASLAAAAIGMVEVHDSSSESDEELEVEEDLEVEEELEMEETLLIEDYDDDPLADRPTLVDEAPSPQVDDTVRIDEEESQGSAFETLVDSGFSNESLIALDPLPSDDEIQSADADDVEVSDFSSPRPAGEPDSLEAELDPELLDLGDMFGDSSAGETETPEIEMLTGEESFEPDEDSLLLTPDPMTGELRFNVNEDLDDDLVLAPEDDSYVDETIEFELDDPQATIEIGGEDVIDFGDAIDDEDDVKG